MVIDLALLGQGFRRRKSYRFVRQTLCTTRKSVAVSGTDPHKSAAPNLTTDGQMAITS